jgi:hypothetical protein
MTFEVDPKRYGFLAVSFVGMMVLFYGNDTNNPIMFWSGIGIIAVSNLVRVFLFRYLKRRAGREEKNGSR